MQKKSANQLKSKKPQKKYRFFLNPYSDCAFTKCPKCETKTKLRKFVLVISIEPKQVLLLNKQCKYCPSCELIIVKKQELEPLLAIAFSEANTKVIGNKYLVLGTLEKQDWQAGNKGLLSPGEIMERMYIFRDEWNFKVIPAGWYPNE